MGHEAVKQSDGLLTSQLFSQTRVKEKTEVNGKMIPQTVVNIHPPGSASTYLID